MLLGIFFQFNITINLFQKNGINENGEVKHNKQHAKRRKKYSQKQEQGKENKMRLNHPL